MKLLFYLVAFALIFNAAFAGFKRRTIHQRIKSIFGRPVKTISYCVCSMHGDPHYSTFDGLVYHFQSVCRYTAATVANAPNNCAFSVDVQNFHIGKNRKVSWIHYIIINMFGNEFRLYRGSKVHINGRPINGYKTADLSITKINGRIIFESERCGVKILFEPSSNTNVFIDKRRYGGKVNGVCGNCDGNRQNDWRTRDGKAVKPTNSLYNAEAIGRSWAVPSDDGRICLGTGHPIQAPKCNGQKLLVARQKCSPLKTKWATFSTCTKKGIIRAHLAVHDQCVQDACALGENSHMIGKLLCSIVKTLSDRCLASGVTIPNWRRTFNCPAPKPAPIRDVCQMPVDRGNCRGAHARFYYDKNKGTCQYFLYGGCGGNENRFETYTDCILKCGGKKKPTPNECSSNEVTITLLQKLRVLIDQVKRPTSDLSYLMPVSRMLQQSISQFQVIMRLFVQMRQMKQQHAMLANYMNLRQMISQLLMVVKRGINHRYQIANNPFVMQNNPLILRIIESYKLMNKVYIGQEKTNIFVNAFDRMNVHDNSEMYQKIIGLMNVHGHLDAHRVDALKVLVPTYLMSGLEKMGRSGFQGNLNLLKTGFQKELHQVQVIATAMQKHVVQKTVIRI